jgi:hypothetical protein
MCILRLCVCAPIGGNCHPCWESCPPLDLAFAATEDAAEERHAQHGALACEFTSHGVRINLGGLAQASKSQRLPDVTGVLVRIHAYVSCDVSECVSCDYV